MSERIEQRKRRIETLRKMLAESNESTDTILARFCCESGVTEFTAKRYLELLSKAGLTDRAV